MSNQVKKPVFVPRSEHKHSDILVDVGRRHLRLSNHMVGEEFRRLETLGYAKQVGEIVVDLPDPILPKPDVTSGSQEPEFKPEPEKDEAEPKEEETEPEKEEETEPEKEEAEPEKEEAEPKEKTTRRRRPRRKK